MEAAPTPWAEQWRAPVGVPVRLAPAPPARAGARSAPDGDAECLRGRGAALGVSPGSCFSMSARSALNCRPSASSGTWSSTCGSNTSSSAASCASNTSRCARAAVAAWGPGAPATDGWGLGPWAPASPQLSCPTQPRHGGAPAGGGGDDTEAARLSRGHGKGPARAQHPLPYRSSPTSANGTRARTWHGTACRGTPTTRHTAGIRSASSVTSATWTTMSCSNTCAVTTTSATSVTRTGPRTTTGGRAPGAGAGVGGAAGSC